MFAHNSDSLDKAKAKADIAFKLYDKDRDWFISKEEFANVSMTYITTTIIIVFIVIITIIVITIDASLFNKSVLEQLAGFKHGLTSPGVQKAE